MVYLLFFLSGAAGLIYEIVWSRSFGLFFGHTVHAAAVVLGAYFVGMTLGYLLAGHWSARLRLPLVGYGVAELVVASWAVATPALIALYAKPWLAQLLNHDAPQLQLAIRAVVAFLTLLPATIALGATLPFIAQYVSPASAPHPRRIALAYGCNTAGAFAGVLLATFVLILSLGVRGSGYLAAALSGACGFVAIWWAYRGVSSPTRDSAAAAEIGAGGEQGGPRLAVSWYVLAALSGLGTLGLQVLYTRMFALTFHNSTYTFGGVVAVFLVALAAASWLVARFAQRFPSTPAAAVACLAGGPVVLASVVVYQSFTDLGYLQAGASFLQYILAALGLVALVVLVPVAFLGTILPFAFVAAPASGGGPGGVVGRLTALNTVFAALGALLTSFLLLPAFGLWHCFVLFALLYVAVGLVVLSKRWGQRRLTLIALALVVVLVFGTLAIDKPSGAVRGMTVLYQRDTAYGLITVLEEQRNGTLWMRQNRHYTLGSTTGADSELRQGHIPLLLHPDPRDVCFLGLATGITASAALVHPEIEHVTAVELIPEVVDGAALFGTYNSDLLSDARVEVLVNDARHYLYSTGRRFDVIISDLFVPWHSQTGYLYTAEHYRASRARLKEGGIFCQWLPLYQLGPVELELIADSFAAVFPYTTLWRGELTPARPLLALVGSEQPLTLNAAQLLVRWAQLPAPWCGQDPVLRQGTDLLELYVGRWPARSSSQLNTDDHPRVEFLAPVTQRARELLVRERLRGYYEDVLLGLPVQGVSFTPLEAEPAPDLGEPRLLQLEALAGG